MMIEDDRQAITAMRANVRTQQRQDYTDAKPSPQPDITAHRPNPQPGGLVFHRGPFSEDLLNRAASEDGKI
jgi:hypothetical protein